MADVNRIATKSNGLMDRQPREPIPFANPVYMHRSFFAAFESFLNSSLAIEKDPIKQREMLNDPDITAPLDQRALSIANLPYSIVPQDETDLTQAAQASAIENHLNRTPGFTQLIHRLEHNAIWFGNGSEEVVYARLENPVVGRAENKSVNEEGEREVTEEEAELTFGPVEFLNLHSDSLVFLLDGTPSILVNSKYPGPKARAHIGYVAPITEDGTFDGERTPRRDTFIIHTYNMQASDYLDARGADSFYRGRGLRDDLFWWWFFKNNSLQLYLTWVERFSFGNRIGECDDDTNAIAAMEECLNNLSLSSSTVMPRSKDPAERAEEIKILEAGGTGADHVMTMIQEYLAAGISLRIIGQRLTMASDATGLGSGLAEQHAETFGRILRFDSKSLAEKLTTDLIHVIHKINFPDTDYLPHLEFSVERINPQDKMAAIAQGANMGMVFKAEELHDITGTTKPEADDETVGGGAGDPMGFGNIEENGQRMIALDQVQRALGQDI